MSEEALYLDKAQPETFAGLRDFGDQVVAAAKTAGLDPALVELVSIRVSQINGCVYCLDIHSRKALGLGEDPRRLSILSAWRDAELFSDEERHALDVAEAVTTLPQAEQRQAIEYAARVRFGDEWFAAVAWLAISMNALNRLSIVSRHRFPRRVAPRS